MVYPRRLKRHILKSGRRRQPRSKRISHLRIRCDKGLDRSESETGRSRIQSPVSSVSGWIALPPICTGVGYKTPYNFIASDSPPPTHRMLCWVNRIRRQSKTDSMESQGDMYAIEALTPERLDSEFLLWS